MWVLSLGFIATALVGFLGAYHSAHPVKQLLHLTPDEFTREISKSILGNIKGENMKEYLRALTKKMHPAGTSQNAEVAELIAQLWRDNGLQDVHFVNYSVLLSYPDYERANRMYITNEDGRIEFSTKGVSPVIIPEEQGDTGAGIQWVAYSGNGTVEGEVVYCHHGREEDFETLGLHGISVKGRIALLRYGKGYRGDKVRQAQLRGAIGAILISDPLEVARWGLNPESVYPNTEWMPNGAVQRGSIMNGKGDPMSPLYPSKKDLYRTRTVRRAKEDGVLPTIPVLPLSYTDAFQILSRMEGPAAPPDWQGGLNVTYRLGPGMRHGQRVRITVRSSLQIRTIRNVIGYIHGTQSPDRYVILGNHYDAWVYGSIDPNSGTAALTEVARAVVKVMNETQWRPARTLMFCSWDAEEHGLIGSTEFVEEFANILSQRAVVYLNVDNIHSNESLSVSTIPTLYQATTEAAKSVRNPMKSEAEKGRGTVYDTWIRTFPNEIPFRLDAPKMDVPGAGSDHAPFLNYIGVPVVDFTYKNATTYDTYPLYHTLYETPFVNEHIIDNDNFSIHVAVGQYWAELAIQFANSAILPFNVSDLANALITMYVPDLMKALDDLHCRPEEIRDAWKQLKYLIKNCQDFLRLAKSLEKDIGKTVKMLAVNPFDYQGASLLNDRIMAVDRCFINPRGLFGRPEERHVLFSISGKDSYSARVMAAVYDQIELFKKTASAKKRHTIAKEIAAQISIVQYSVQCASNALLPVI